MNSYILYIKWGFLTTKMKSFIRSLASALRGLNQDKENKNKIMGIKGKPKGGETRNYTNR